MATVNAIDDSHFELQSIDEEDFDVMELCREADELYTMIVCDLEKEYYEGSGTISIATTHQVLEQWTLAGEKYAKAVKCHVNQGTDKAKIQSRFGYSLFAFGTQLLKHLTSVYTYEEYFGIVNARVYTVAADMWTQGMDKLPMSMAFESFFLSSKVLTQALDIWSEQLPSRKESDEVEPQTSTNDGENKEYLHLNETSRPNNSEDIQDYSAKYVETALFLAKCYAACGDLLTHNTFQTYEDQLAQKIEKDQLYGQEKKCDSSPQVLHFDREITSASSPGTFFNEARKLYVYTLDHFLPNNSYKLSNPSVELSKTLFKLSSLVPRGSTVMKKLLADSLEALSNNKQTSKLLDSKADKDKLLAYLKSITSIRCNVFRTEGDRTDFASAPNCSGKEAFASFYQFLFMEAIREVDTNASRLFDIDKLSKLNDNCGQEVVSESTMKWLIETFDSEDEYLTEKGVFDYFAWFAEADPVGFCQTLHAFMERQSGEDIGDSAIDIIHRLSTKKMRQSHASKWLMDSALIQSRKNSRGTPIAEHLVVLSGEVSLDGAQALTSTRSPSDVRLDSITINELPSEHGTPEEMAKFCFPNGIRFLEADISPSTFDLVLTDVAGTQLFGSCLRFAEAMDTMDVLDMIESQSDETIPSLPKWLKLRNVITNQEEGSSWECYLPKCICLLSKFPIFRVLQSALVQLYRLSTSSFPALKREAYLFNLLEDIPMPSPTADQIRFTLADKLEILSSYHKGSSISSSVDFDFTLLFQCLSSENILKVYALLLTEKKIVLCSAKPALLTPICETFRALIKPFECRLVYIPVLPMSLLDFTSSPVPFFMGIPCERRLERLTSDGVTVVDLDTNEIFLPQNEYCPTLPENKGKKLLLSLRKVVGWCASQRSKDNVGEVSSEIVKPLSFIVQPTEFHPQFEDIERAQRFRHDKWREVQLLFAAFSASLLKDFRKYCQTYVTPDGESRVTFDGRSFLSVHPALRDFCYCLFQTQLFQHFIEQHAYSTDAETWTQLEQFWRVSRGKGNPQRKAEYLEATTQKKSSILLAPTAKTTPLKRTMKVDIMPEEFKQAARQEKFPPLDNSLYIMMLQSKYSDPSQSKICVEPIDAEPASSMDAPTVASSVGSRKENIDIDALVKSARRHIDQEANKA